MVETTCVAGRVGRIGTFGSWPEIGFQKAVYLPASRYMLPAFYGRSWLLGVCRPRSCSAPRPWVHLILDRHTGSSATTISLPSFIGAFRVSRRLGIPCKWLPLLSLPHNLCPVSQAVVTRLARVFDSFRTHCHWPIRISSAGTRAQLSAPSTRKDPVLLVPYPKRTDRPDWETGWLPCAFASSGRWPDSQATRRSGMPMTSPHLRHAQ